MFLSSLIIDNTGNEPPSLVLLGLLIRIYSQLMHNRIYLSGVCCPALISSGFGHFLALSALLFCTILSWDDLVLACLVLSYFVLLSGLVLSCLVLACFGLTWLVMVLCSGIVLC